MFLLGFSSWIVFCYIYTYNNHIINAIITLKMKAKTPPTTIEKKGMATGWKIAIVLFIIIAMIAIFFAIKNKQDD